VTALVRSSSAITVATIGFVLTVLMQSSSAAIAIILTAVGGGVVPLRSGAALLVGANVGTTSTALLATIGATPNAKRIATGHVAFNVITGAVALVLLPLLLLATVRARELLRMDAEPAAVLAGFHTVFNLLGVALIWPLAGRLRDVAELLARRKRRRRRASTLSSRVIAHPSKLWFGNNNLEPMGIWPSTRSAQRCQHLDTVQARLQLDPHSGGRE
jgi:Na+/phosphate symporter